MNIWTDEELKKIGEAEELLIATRRNNGTLREQVIIWVVRVGDGLYVRCVGGREGAWFRGVLTQHAGRIQAGGVTKDVIFVEEAEPGINDQIDTAYQVKYRRYPQYVPPCLTPKAKAATIKLVPQTAVE